MPAPRVIARIAAVMAFLLSAATHAAPEPKVDCSDAVSTYEMNFCAGEEFERADGELNRVYRKALAAIPEMAVEEPRFNAKSWEAALRASQRAWLAFRDAECDEHVPMFWSGGTGATADVIGCKTTLTQARTTVLKERYEVK